MRKIKIDGVLVFLQASPELKLQRVDVDHGDFDPSHRKIIIVALGLKDQRYKTDYPVLHDDPLKKECHQFFVVIHDDDCSQNRCLCVSSFRKRRSSSCMSR